MGANDKIWDRIIKTRAGHIRYERKTARRIRRTFRSVRDEILGYFNNQANDIVSTYSAARRRYLVDTIDGYLERGRHESSWEVYDAMTGTARREAEETYDAFRSEIPSEIGLSFYAVPEDFLIAIADQPVMGNYTMGLVNYGDKWSRDAATLLDKALMQSVVNGENVGQLARRMALAVGVQNYAMQAFARTAIQTAAHRAQMEFFRRNKEVIKGVQWVAILDDACCDTCAGYDGRIFKRSEAVHQPVHVKCRCTYSAVTKSWKELGLKGDEAPPWMRRTMDGEVPETMTFKDWIDKKMNSKTGRSWVRDWMGPGKFELFSNGLITLDDMAIRTRRKNRVRSLGDLRRIATRRRRKKEESLCLMN